MFKKLLKKLLKLRRLGVRQIIYVDDLCLLNKSRTEGEAHLPKSQRYRKTTGMSENAASGNAHSDGLASLI